MPANPLLLYGLASDLLECARAELATLAQGAPDWVAVVPGQPAFDDCCESGGQLYAYVEDVAPTLTDTLPSGLPLGEVTPFMAVQIVVGVVRCTPTLDDEGGAPTPEQLDENAQLILSDQYAVWRGVVCCLMAAVADGDLEGRLVGSTTLVPNGGCAGSELRVIVSEPDACTCP